MADPRGGEFLSYLTIPESASDNRLSASGSGPAITQSETKLKVVQSSTLTQYNSPNKWDKLSFGIETNLPIDTINSEIGIDWVWKNKFGTNISHGSSVAVRRIFERGYVGSGGDSESETTSALYTEEGLWDNHKG